MAHQTKPRPLLALAALSATLATATAPAVAAPVVSTFFAYTAPLPAAPASGLHLASVALGFTVAALAAAFVPARRARPVEVPATTAAGGPIFCPVTRRWRDPVSRRFVKAPR